MRTAGVALSPSTETLAGSGVFQTGQRRAARRRTLAAGSSCAAALGDKINEPAGAWQSLSSPARGRGAGAPAGRCLVPDLPPRPTIPVSAVIYWRANVSQRFVNTGSGGLLWRRPWELSRAVSPALGLLLLETRARNGAAPPRPRWGLLRRGGRAPWSGQALASTAFREASRMGFGARLQVLPVVSHVASQGGGSWGAAQPTAVVTPRRPCWG